MEIATNITEQKQQERLAGIQRDLAVQVSATAKLEEGLSLCLDAAIEASEMDCGGIYLVNEDSGALELSVHKGLSDGFIKSVTHYDADSDNGKLIMKGEPVYTEYKQLCVLLSHTEKKEGLSSIAVVPVLNEGRVIGCLNIASHVFNNIHARSRLALETITAQIGSTVTRLKTADALRQSDERLRLAVQAAQLITWDVDLLTDEMHLGGNSNELLGLAPEIKSISISYLWEQFNPNDLEQFQQAVDRAINEGTLLNQEHRIVRPDGTERWITAQGQTVYDKTGKAVRMIGISQDITERKKAEESLLRSEQMFRTYFKLGQVGMAVTSPEKGWIYVNDKLCEILGYPRDELIQTTWTDLTHPDDLEADISHFERVLAGQINSYSMDKRFIRKDGRIIYISLSVACVRREDGSVEHFIAHLHHITGRKKAEEALREQRERAQKYLDVAGVMFVVLDANGVITLLNKKGCEVLGYKEEDIIGKKWFDNFLPDKIKDNVALIFNKLIAGEIEPVEYFENSVLTKDGEERLIAWHNTILRDSLGNITGTLSSGEDITERRRAEEAMKKSSIIIDSTTDIVITTDIAGNITFWNKGAEILYGYPKEEAIGKPVSIIYKEEDLHVLEAMIADLMEGKDIPSIELTCIDKNQQDVEVLVSLTSIRDKDGNITELVGITKDITERKKAQEALLQSEEKFRTMFELSPYSTVLLDLEGNIIACNQRFARLHATKEGPEAQVGRSASEFFPEEERPRLSSEIHKTAAGKQLEQSEFTMLREDGTKFRAETKSTVVMDELGKPYALLATAYDVTERRQAEDKLRQSEERFKILFESAPDAYYIHDLDGHFIDGNKAGEQLIGYRKEEVIGDNFVNLDLVAEEDIPKVLEAMAINKDSKPAGPLELTLYRKDGSKVMVETRSYPVEISGQTVVLGIARDITERKKAEVALRQSEQRLKILFQYAPDAIYLIDLKGNIVNGNKTAEKMIGYEEDELIGQNFMEAGLLSSEQVVRAIASLEKNAMGKPTGPEEFTLTRKDGSTVPVEIRTFPVKIGDQVLSLGIARDISARKKTEQKLFEHRAQLKSLASELSLTEERERHRLATDLHDHISQALVFSRIKLQELHASVSSAEIAGPLEEACNNLDRIIQDTRTLTFDLSSPILYELGFEAAVSEWLEEQIGKKQGVKTQFEDDGQPKPLEDDIRVLLFRNVRELLINIVKHADAKNVKVSIRRINQQIYVCVEDDGIGFNPAEVASNAGFGIFSIRERLEQLAGHIEIESEPGQGTKVTMTAPLKREELLRDDKLKDR
jgi:PAS domain S-box-containing protein